MNTFSNFLKDIPFQFNRFTSGAREFGNRIASGFNTFHNNLRSVHSNLSKIPFLGALYNASPIGMGVGTALNVSELGGNLLHALSGGHLKNSRKAGVEIAKTFGISPEKAESKGRELERMLGKGRSIINSPATGNLINQLRGGKRRVMA